MERSVWGNQWRGTGLPGSLATKLINFSKVGREMEEEAHSWGFLSQQQLVGPPRPQPWIRGPERLTFSPHEASHPARPAAVHPHQDWTGLDSPQAPGLGLLDASPNAHWA